MTWGEKNAVKELLLNSTQQVRDLNGLQSHSRCETSLTKNHRHFVELRGSLKKQAEFMSRNFFQGMEKHCRDCLLAGCSSKEIPIDLNKGCDIWAKRSEGAISALFFQGKHGATPGINAFFLQPCCKIGYDFGNQCSTKKRCGFPKKLWDLILLVQHATVDCIESISKQFIHYPPERLIGTTNGCF